MLLLKEAFKGGEEKWVTQAISPLTPWPGWADWEALCPSNVLTKSFAFFFYQSSGSFSTYLWTSYWVHWMKMPSFSCEFFLPAFLFLSSFIEMLTGAGNLGCSKLKAKNYCLAHTSITIQSTMPGTCHSFSISAPSKTKEGCDLFNPLGRCRDKVTSSNNCSKEKKNPEA